MSVSNTQILFFPFPLVFTCFFTGDDIFSSVRFPLSFVFFVFVMSPSLTTRQLLEQQVGDEVQKLAEEEGAVDTAPVRRSKAARVIQGAELASDDEQESDQDEQAPPASEDQEEEEDSDFISHVARHAAVEEDTASVASNDDLQETAQKMAAKRLTGQASEKKTAPKKRATKRKAVELDNESKSSKAKPTEYDLETLMENPVIMRTMTPRDFYASIVSPRYEGSEDVASKLGEKIIQFLKLFEVDNIGIFESQLTKANKELHTRKNKPNCSCGILLLDEHLQIHRNHCVAYWQNEAKRLKAEVTQLKKELSKK